MACPYFIPEKRCETELWTHRTRLPLGDGYAGSCSAPGHEGATPSEEELKSACNLGNSRCCRLPEDRALDSVRFHVKFDEGTLLGLSYCTEREHHPREHGMLQFDAASGTFIAASTESAVLRLAQAFIQSHLQRHPRANSARV